LRYRLEGVVEVNAVAINDLQFKVQRYSKAPENASAIHRLPLRLG
jgi:hypothetical protein